MRGPNEIIFNVICVLSSFLIFSDHDPKTKTTIHQQVLPHYGTPYRYPMVLVQQRKSNQFICQPWVLKPRNNNKNRVVTISLSNIDHGKETHHSHLMFYVFLRGFVQDV